MDFQDTVIISCFRYFGQATLHHMEKSDDKSESKNTLKDVSNKMEKQTKPKSPQKSPFAAPSIDRLTDSSINILMTDLENETESTKSDKDNDSSSVGKENKTVEYTQIKRENTFRWKPSLSEMFGFEIKNISSSPAVNKKFVRPSSSEAVNVNDFENNINAKSVRRNPFAKVVKVEENNDSLCSQSTSLNDSESDSLTPDTNSEVCIEFGVLI